MDRDLLPGMVNTPMGPMRVGTGAVGDTTLICDGKEIGVKDPPSYGWVWGLFGLVLGVAGLAGAQMYGYAPAMRKRNPARSRFDRREIFTMQQLLKAHGYDPLKASQLFKEGMGPIELEHTLTTAPSGVGSLPYTHGFAKVTNHGKQRMRGPR